MRKTKLRRYSKRLFALTCLVSAITLNLQAGVLLSDDFNTSPLNPTKWTTNTSLIDAYGTPAVLAQNQRVEIRARGYLNTVTNYDPLASGGLLVIGTWKFLSVGPGDGPKVVTRSSGTPTTYQTSAGEVTYGIAFTVVVPDGLALITGWGGANVTGHTVVSNTLNLAQGDTANFRITDDGTNLTYHLVNATNLAQAAYVTAVCTNHPAVNKVSFYNREYQSNIVAVDDVVIRTITTEPELHIVAPIALNRVALFWPASATNYSLETSTNLVSTNWTAVTDGEPLIGVMLTNVPPGAFFRLKSQ